jgi:hypothetical protein
MKFILILFILAIFSEGCLCDHGRQSKQSKAEAFESTNSVPETVDDAIARLKQLLTDSMIDEIKAQATYRMTISQFNVRLGIINYWLFKGAPLRTYFNERGIYDREDMSDIVLVLFWRSLHGFPINVEDQIAHSKAGHASENLAPPHHP